jgi:tRNA U34 5-methylaminomethyl-2-thiouridine-forming methyltransferase MnmC
MKIEIVKTEDGSDTLFVPDLNEHYHSVHGAIGESEFVFLNTGYSFVESDQLRIFEAGFGTGLNALLTAIRSFNENRSVKYTAIEKYPLSEEIVRSLNYKDHVSREGKKFFEMIHTCRWSVEEEIHKKFTLHKIMGDLLSDDIDGSFDLIYFDAFGPDKQPEMWSDEIFKKLSEHTANGGILVTYSAKGEVRRRLEKYGFKVSLLPGPPGKRQIIRAAKI